MPDAPIDQFTLTLSREELAIAIAVQCAGIQFFIQNNEMGVARRYKDVTDKMMAMAKEQGLDLLEYMQKKAQEEAEDNG